MEKKCLNIAICDDDLGCCRKLESWLTAEDIETSVYNTAESLFESIKRGNIFDIIFLDIDFDGLSGIEVGQEIRRYIRRDRVNIVYISGKQGYAMALFEIEPLNFHVKPLKKEKILCDVGKVRRRMEESMTKLRYKNVEGIQMEVESGDILYIESSHGYVTVHTKDGGKVCFRASLYKIADMLKISTGCQCHRSFWVNLTCVATYLNQKLYLYDGTEVRVGREYRDRVREKWVEYRAGGD